MSSAKIVNVLVDHHTHLFSPEAATIVSEAIGRRIPPFDGSELAGALNEDGVDLAIVLSVAYMHPSAKAVAAENDWVAEQCRQDQRLTPFLSVNPLQKSAVAELRRCVTLDSFRGLKLHFANSGIDLLDSDHVDRVNAVVRAAAEAGLPIVIHLRSSREWPLAAAKAFVSKVLPNTSGVAVQLAHLSGWGGWDAETSASFDLFACEVEAGRAANLYFDVSAVLRGEVDASEQVRLQVARVPRERVLFGTDWPDWRAKPYREALTAGGLGDLITDTAASWLK